MLEKKNEKYRKKHVARERAEKTWKKNWDVIKRNEKKDKQGKERLGKNKVSK